MMSSACQETLQDGSSSSSSAYTHDTLHQWQLPKQQCANEPMLMQTTETPKPQLYHTPCGTSKLYRTSCHTNTLHQWQLPKHQCANELMLMQTAETPKPQLYHTLCGTSQLYRTSCHTMLLATPKTEMLCAVQQAALAVYPAKDRQPGTSGQSPFYYFLLLFSYSF
jgi:hypothetical protein